MAYGLKASSCDPLTVTKSYFTSTVCWLIHLTLCNFTTVTSNILFIDNWQIWIIGFLTMTHVKNKQTNKTNKNKQTNETNKKQTNLTCKLNNAVLQSCILPFILDMQILLLLFLVDEFLIPMLNDAKWSVYIF